MMQVEDKLKIGSLVAATLNYQKNSKLKPGRSAEDMLSRSRAGCDPARLISPFFTAMGELVFLNFLWLFLCLL